jgi:hypothetical protein
MTASTLRLIEDDHFKDQCGIFGVFGHPEASNLTYLGLYACSTAARNPRASWRRMAIGSRPCAAWAS